MVRQGMLLVISAPAGTGKTTLCRELLRRFTGMRESISYTTRSPRPDEVNGADYHFISPAQFRRMIGQNTFAEWSEVHGNLYGTSLESLTEARANGADLLLNIDCQGTEKLKERFKDICSVFILPPSLQELRRRLEQRGTDTSVEIEGRLMRAAEEIRTAGGYDYIVVNDSLPKALDDISAILTAHRLKAVHMLPLARALICCSDPLHET